MSASQNDIFRWSDDQDEIESALSPDQDPETAVTLSPKRIIAKPKSVDDDPKADEVRNESTSVADNLGMGDSLPTPTSSSSARFIDLTQPDTDCDPPTIINESKPVGEIHDEDEDSATGENRSVSISMANNVGEGGASPISSSARSTDITQPDIDGESGSINEQPGPNATEELQNEDSVHDETHADTGGDDGDNVEDESSTSSSGGAVANENNENAPSQAEVSRTSNVTSWKKIYICILLKLLYYMGVIPYDAVRNAGEEISPHPIQRIVFAFITAISVMQGLDLIKHAFLSDDYEDKKLLYFVTLAFLVNNFIFRAYFTLLLWLRKNKLLRLLKTMEKYVESQNLEKTNQAPTVYVILLTSLVVALLYPVCYAAYIFSFDFGDIIRYQAWRFSVSVFVWSGDYDEESLMEGRITASLAAKAMAKTTISSVGILTENLVKDVGLTLALSIWTCTDDIVKKIKPLELDPEQDNSRIRPNIWSEYRLLRTISTLTDDSFGLLLQLIHFDNSLFCIYFLLNTVVYQQYDYIALLEIIALAKIASFYTSSAYAATVNPEMQKWIKATYKMDDVVYEEDDVTVPGEGRISVPMI